MKSAVAFISFSLFFAGISAPGAQEGAPLSVSSGLFTKEQVQRGRSLYETKCALCHGSELIADDPEAGDLTGTRFRLGWHGKTVAERFEAIRTTMPPGRPFMLSDQEYLDIVTHILNFNGYPVGEKELTPDLKRLEQIVIAPQPQEQAK